jgi:hypothetical protein
VVDALEAGEPVPVPAERDEEEIEVLARDLAESGVEAHEVDTPFAWADEAEGEPVTTDPAGVEPISAYFDRLLDWDSRERS